MKHRRETEIKLLAGGRRQVQKRLSQLGFEVLKARHFEKNYLFDFSDLRLRRSGCLLRLRFADGEVLLTFKGPPLRPRRYESRHETETRVEDGVLLREVLKHLGLKQVFIYEKYRTTYAEDNRADFHGVPQVAYDETPIGNYLELEGPEKWIDAVATRLGYSPPDYITSTYLALYFHKCQEEGKKPGNMVFKGRKSRLGPI
jgi:adenylate cyclase class 2